MCTYLSSPWCVGSREDGQHSSSTTLLWFGLRTPPITPHHVKGTEVFVAAKQCECPPQVHAKLLLFLRGQLLRLRVFVSISTPTSLPPKQCERERGGDGDRTMLYACSLRGQALHIGIPGLAARAS